MIVEMEKKYRLKGYPESEVHIYDTNLPYTYGGGDDAPTVLARVRKSPSSTYSIEFYFSDGTSRRSRHGGDEGWCLVEVGPYDDFKIDEPVMVRDGDRVWERGYFAGVNEDGRPLVWDDGGTSWTCSNDKEENTTWYYQCRRPTEGELKC